MENAHFDLDDPHRLSPVERSGVPLGVARNALVLLHGRGADARSILELGRQLEAPETALLAPQAAGNTWYPHSFLRPIEENEPALSSALRCVARTIGVAVEYNIPLDKIVLAGFSQGACVALEYVARHPGRYGGVLGFSGGLIGPPGTAWTVSFALGGTPVFLGCSDIDAHIPLERVNETATHFRTAGADVVKKIYPGMDHTINEDELQEAARIMDRLQSA